MTVQPLPTALALAAAALLAGCAVVPAPVTGPVARDTGGSVAQPARPLARLAGQRALLLPVQQVQEAAALGVTAEALDAELAFALEERGAAPGWTTAAGVRRLAARNAAYASDPARLPIPAGARLRAGDPIGEPLAAALRPLAALADARHAVVPLALRVEGEGATAHALLRLLLVDVRTAEVVWAGQTVGLALAEAPPAARASQVAVQFADLVAAPPPP